MSPSAAATAAGSAGGLKRVPSMLFEMELEESSLAELQGHSGAERHARGAELARGAPLGDSLAETSPATYELRNLVKPRGQFQERVREAVEAASRAQQPSQRLYGMDKAAGQKYQLEKWLCVFKSLLLAEFEDASLSVVVRTSVGGGVGGECLQNLRHSFVIVGGDTVIEPSFREQFAVARPSAEYQRFYESIPEFFVGTMAVLTRAVNLICSEMSRSFAENNLSVPAWRKKQGLLSKWRPKKWEDRRVTLDLDALANNKCAVGLQSVGVSKQTPAAVRMLGIS
uniref:Uncharacterized protein n=1 Tax=Chloropicon laureae TaxID=464258 RepID=A0A7S2Z3N7_9CHLO|mmetsp:Transcript_4440/g.11195  ORF Transcript_4440/g.11195 Transcript_4440/m.11195 type:complete len:284 (+) Transcript_4440:603-1454(+)|eukprot:CAMPEP_0197499052 /NCGR_PEP_ID=MMETSP1311-20131121/60827_1 /TAXON_ID=464262 /ORGANISM="Genus nov. species nov., Strain RCC856" /LENGTH=283 /DNA_ID=CAMNT_0043044793 /DNA_START=625 /DNA_END=1476 /DNA_ORIENTATION=+